MNVTIYGVLRSRASRNVWLARELGLAFRHVPVIQAYRLADAAAPDAPLHTGSPAFLAVNPNGLIPAAEIDGTVLHESLAVNLHLAKRHGGPLAPADLAEDGLMTMWSLWAAAECEPHTIMVLTNGAGRADRPADPARAQAARETLMSRLPVLETALRDGGGHPVGRRFTVADINLAEVLRYAQGAPELFRAHPQVARWLAACQDRPAFRAMMAEREREPA